MELRINDTQMRADLAVWDVVLVLSVSSTTWAQVAPPLGTAAAFGVLGNSAVTGATGTGVLVSGDVGSSPTAYHDELSPVKHCCSLHGPFFK